MESLFLTGVHVATSELHASTYLNVISWVTVNDLKKKGHFWELAASNLITWLKGFSAVGISERDAKINLNIENMFAIFLRNGLHKQLLKIFQVGPNKRGQETCIVVI